ncbi:unnamed protein product, partial [Chrysoparadoxa australica]
AAHRPDGSVTGWICGDHEAVTAVETWLWQGPSAARVSQVELADSDSRPPSSFDIS